MGVPPYTHTVANVGAVMKISFSTCFANSRVGANTIHFGFLDLEPSVNNRSTIGNENANVFPVPVLARPTTSCPDSAGSNTACCMGNNVSTPRFLSAATVTSDIPKFPTSVGSASASTCITVSSASATYASPLAFASSIVSLSARVSSSIASTSIPSSVSRTASNLESNASTSSPSSSRSTAAAATARARIPARCARAGDARATRKVERAMGARETRRIARGGVEGIARARGGATRVPIMIGEL